MLQAELDKLKYAMDSGAHVEKIKLRLSWAEKYVKDKRSRPAPVKAAIKLLKSKGLYESYLDEYGGIDE